MILPRLSALLIVIGLSEISCQFDSSKTNAGIANRNYQNDPIQRWVATNFGDEFPKMRDDLIERKNQGEGAVERHFNAWMNPSNWEVDPNNDLKEKADPYYKK